MRVHVVEKMGGTTQHASAHTQIGESIERARTRAQFSVRVFVCLCECGCVYVNVVTPESCHERKKKHPLEFPSPRPAPTPRHISHHYQQQYTQRHRKGRGCCCDVLARARERYACVFVYIYGSYLPPAMFGRHLQYMLTRIAPTEQQPPAAVCNAPRSCVHTKNSRTSAACWLVGVVVAVAWWPRASCQWSPPSPGDDECVKCARLRVFFIALRDGGLISRRRLVARS